LKFFFSFSTATVHSKFHQMTKYTRVTCN
jgi:hypothetical protein